MLTTVAVQPGHRPVTSDFRLRQPQQYSTFNVMCKYTTARENPFLEFRADLPELKFWNLKYLSPTKETVRIIPFGRLIQVQTARQRLAQCRGGDRFVKPAKQGRRASDSHVGEQPIE